MPPFSLPLLKHRWLRWVGVASGVLVVGILGVLHLFGDFSMSQTEIERAFAEAGVVFELREVEGISYVETGNAEGSPIVFVHGSPGSWDNFISYLLDPDLRKAHRLIAVNRLGFGGDAFGVPEASLTLQAEAVMKVVPEDRPVVLVGHSMGGPVVAKAAMIEPDRVSGLVLLSAAVDPDLERVMWIQRVGAFPLISWLLPSALDVCNRELIPLEEELREMEPGWAELDVPILAVHGDEDGLVPVENMTFLEDRVAEEGLEVRILEGANHFIPWTHEAEVKRAVMEIGQVD